MRGRTLIAVLVVGGLAVWSAVGPRSLFERPERPALEIATAGRAESAAGAREVYSPPIRVLLTPESVASVTVSCDGPWELRPVGSDRVLARGDKLAETQAVATATGLRIGATSHPAGRLEIVPAKSPGVWIDGHQYRGAIRLFRRADRKIAAVNVVPLEEYVASVVDGEMPASFPDEARKAQAILARSFALFRAGEAAGHPEFDLYATTRSQKYLGFQYRTSDGRRLAGETESGRRCARATAGVVCTAEGRVFSTYYCAVCGGGTIDGRRVFTDAASVIQGVRCEWCRESKRYRWSETMTKSEAGRRLKGHFQGRGESFGALQSLVRQGADDGPATLFEARDGVRARTVSAVELRRMMPSSVLHSPFFTVSDAGDSLTFTGRGHGHGAGVCQWGARGQALENRTCYEILRHYYPGVSFVVVAK